MSELERLLLRWRFDDMQDVKAEDIAKEVKGLFNNLIDKVEAGQFGEKADFALSELRQKVVDL